MTGWELSLLGLGALAGVGAGAAASWLVVQVRSALVAETTVVDKSEPAIGIPSEMDAQVQAAAAEWAQANGIPEAEAIIANKLRLGLFLRSQPRQQRGGRRWIR